MMAASIGKSVLYPISCEKTTRHPLSKTPTNGNTTKISTKSTYKAIPNENSYAMTTVDHQPHHKADGHDTLYSAKSEFALHDAKQRRPDIMHADAFGFGRMVQNGLVFNQNFLIRSYEVGADQKASIQTFMNHLQESALNHVKLIGLQNDGFGCSPEMTKKNLIWVFSKIQLLVDRYPSWGDIVEVDTWLAPQGKHGTRRDWHVRDHHSGQTILQATSLFVMMNKLTRKLAKVPDEVRIEWEPYLSNWMPLVNEDEHKHSNSEQHFYRNNTEKYLVKGLTPKFGDLDPNDHVNNVKYIGWILESSPMDILEKQELMEMTLEYRRECRRNDVVQSLTTIHHHSSGTCNSVPSISPASIHCDHLLSLESGATIVKARSAWRPKQAPIRAI